MPPAHIAGFIASRRHGSAADTPSRRAALFSDISPDAAAGYEARRLHWRRHCFAILPFRHIDALLPPF